MQLKIAFAMAGSLALGWYASSASHRERTASPAISAQKREIAYYQSPMHPWVTSPQPGKCTVCGMELVPVYRSGAKTNAGDQVLLPPASIRAMGMQTTAVEKTTLVRTVRFSGRFEEDATSHAVISAPVEGRIDALGLVHDNGKITQRQPMANIFSRTLLAAAEEYREALKQDEATVAAARRKLEEYGLVWEQIKSIPTRQETDLDFGLLSTRTGVVVKSYVSEGQYVRAGDKLFEIADPARLWFMFPAYEQDLASLEVGQFVEIEPGNRTGTTVTGRLASIGRHVDDATRTVDVRVEVDNPKGQLLLGEDGRGTIALTTPGALTVPRSAILWPGGSPRVYVEATPEAYVPCIVQLGRAGDDSWEVLGGLSKGVRVVTHGNMLLDGQAQLNRLPASTATQ